MIEKRFEQIKTVHEIAPVFLKDEIRIISIDEVRLIDGPVLDQCGREIMDVLGKTEESCVLLHFGRVAFMSCKGLMPALHLLTTPAVLHLQ